MSYYYPEAVISSTTIKTPDDTAIEISFERITPAMAEEWLTTNVDRQRKVNAGVIKQYVSQLRKGLWVPDTGEAIKFSKKGLIDGQHRLHSVIEYGQPVVLMVMRGINDDHISKVDLGKKRSLTDLFRIQGIKAPKGVNENNLSSVVSGLYFCKMYMSATRTDSKSFRVDAFGQTKPTPLELLEFLEANKSIVERLGKLSEFQVPTIAKHVAPGPAIVGWFLCDIIDEFAARDILLTFQECLPQTGKGRKCPAFMLFQYIQRARANKVNINKHEYPALFLWALDHMMTDREPKNVRVYGTHMPGQGHEGSRVLKEYFRELETVS